MGQKAVVGDFLGRFREIISDPLNLVIRRDPRAGFVEGNNVYLHNGLKVPLTGSNSYYGGYSSILVINRGVHEPLEEFVFQEALNRFPSSPLMLELGAYWGHYSMWLKMARPDASVHLVEPELQNLNAGKHNFEQNGFIGEFTQAFVGKGNFGVDKYVAKKNLHKIDILHCDIQGYEMEMLEDCSKSLASNIIDYIFISTHSQELHQNVINRLQKFNYRIEVSSDFDLGTTSFDGLIFATNQSIEPVFNKFTPMSRVQIEEAQPKLAIEYLSSIMRTRP